MSLLRIRLLTGRYHQIRVQLAHMGHPIVGDRAYGSKQDLPGNAIALHNWELSIPHPVGDRELCRILAPSPGTSPWSEFAGDLPRS
jgi:23S rRNA pseudouridine1911/1915/1917 synthase